MAKNSNIEWTDHTFNPWIGCTKISRACDLCYAERRMDARLHRVQWGAGQPRQRTKTWRDPVKWNAAHEAFYAQHGRRQRVFCASLADVFDNEVPQLWRTELFGLIHDTPNLDWLLLTKRIGNAARMLREDAPEGIDMANLPNVWIGATICDQPEADRDIQKLQDLPARVRFLSIEPMLGPIDLTRVMRASSDGWTYCDDALRGFKAHKQGGYTDPGRAINWVICGSESGPHARRDQAMLDWVRSLRDQCQAAGVAFLWKQDADRGRKIPTPQLDGRSWVEFPTTSAR